MSTVRYIFFYVPKRADIDSKTFKCGGGAESLRTECKQCTPTIDDEGMLYRLRHSSFSDRFQ